MKNFTKYLPVLFTCFILTSCASVNDSNATLQNTDSQILSSDNNLTYVVTARAIVDRMPKTTNVSDQDKLVKDFTEQIKNLNRPALEGLLKYSVKVLQETTPAGQDLLKMPVVKLIHATQSRYLDVLTNSAFMRKSDDIFSIAIMKNPVEQEKAVQKFEKTSFKNVPKTDLKLLIQYIKGELGNFGDFLDPKSSISKRLVKTLELALNA